MGVIEVEVGWCGGKVLSRLGRVVCLVEVEGK